MAKTAICFWGITRYPEGVIESIRKNIFQKARNLGETKVFCHFFNLKILNNQRSGERDIFLENNWELFNPDNLIFDEPNIVIDEYFKNIKKYGDAFNDNYKSLSNLLHALYSLKKVFNSCKNYKADSYLFVRPDLLYFDSIERYLNKSLFTKEDCIFLPAWQSHNGLNDRFSICSTRNAALTYATRIDYAIDFCRSKSQPLHSEYLLKYAVEKSENKIVFINTRAARVRANKKIKKEDFKIAKRLIPKILIQNIFLDLVLLRNKLKKFYKKLLKN